MIKRLIELHRFFCRKSQHYVLGGWYEHQDEARKREYRRGFLRAYVRFMWFSLR